MVEGVHAVIARDGEEACGAHALADRLCERFADPVETRLAGAVIEGQYEYDTSTRPVVLRARRHKRTGKCQCDGDRTPHKRERAHQADYRVLQQVRLLPRSQARG